MRTPNLLTLIAGVSLLLACGSDPAPYATGDLGQDSWLPGDAAGDSLDIPFPDLGELPDASGVTFTDPGALAVKVLSPSSQTNFSVSSGAITGTPAPSVSLGGVVWGPWTSLSVENDLGQKIEVPLPAEPPGALNFFSAAPISLRPPELMGDVYEVRTTVLKVVVQDDQGHKAWDTVRVTAIPGFQFPSPLRRYPDAVFSDESTDVLFTLDLNRVSGFNPAEVVIMESDATCSNKLGLSAKFMADDGDLVLSGDQLPQDQVYTKAVRVTKGPAGVRYFRAAISVDMQGQKLVAYTPCVPLFVVNRISEVACTSAQQALKKAQQLYDAQLAANIPLEQAKRVVVAWLLSVPVVSQAGASPDDPLVWVAFEAGFAGAVAPALWPASSPTTLFATAGEKPASLTPPSSRLVASLTDSDSQTWSQFLDELDCPPWRNVDGATPLSLLGTMGRTGLAFLTGSGGTAFAGLDLAWLEPLDPGFSTADGTYPTALPGLWRAPQSVLFTTQTASCQQLMAGPDSCVLLPDGGCCTDCNAEPKVGCPSYLECRVTQAASNQTPVGTLLDKNQLDLALGRLVLGPETWGITSAYVSAYGGAPSGPDVAFLGYGHSLDAPGMAMAFFSSGTRTVVGASGEASPTQGQISGTNLFRTAIQQDRTLAELVPVLGQSWNDHPWRLAGAGDVDLSFADLINPDFAGGSLKGWDATGDARILANWCGQGPTGSYMAFLSTGVAFTPQTGAIQQEFCLPVGKLVFRTSFQFVSHELTASCGIPQYQDQMQMTLESQSGQVLSLLGDGVDAVTVDMLCPCDAGSCGTCMECGSPDCTCGVWYAPPGQPALSPWPEACYFDAVGEAWTSGWRTPAGVNVSGLAGQKKPLTIRISVSDRGDSSTDTSVLIDSLEFE